MQLIYEGTDITEYCDVVKCVHRDVSGGRSDSLELELENAETWYRWAPQRDDRIEVQMDGYSTGALYLSTILPEKGRYRIWATSLPSAARRKAYAAYKGMQLSDIVAACAAECGMGSALYGLDKGIAYPYMLRHRESAAAFLSRILQWEGAPLKALDGRLIAIDIRYAQGLDAAQTIEIDADTEGIRHIRRDDARLASIAIKTPYAYGRAEDAEASYGQHEIYTEYPATDAAQAARWAGGLLLFRNREAEELTLDMEYNPGLTASARIDIQSTTDAAGKWLIDEAEHDFYEKRSRARLVRCIETIR
jgi:phage protein D